MLGGHLHPDTAAEHPALSVCILGSAQKLLRSHLAQTGDKIVLAVDLEGRAGCSSVSSWDANSGKSSEELLARLEVLPSLAERELVFACKDISNAGLLGTIAIMMENSGTGALIDCPAIPKPASLDLRSWLLCFQSYGFVLCVNPKNTKEVLDMFSRQKITAQVIGEVLEEPKVQLQDGKEVELLFDFTKEIITGISIKSSFLENR
jgi:selenophosphate synthetase-related protein